MNGLAETWPWARKMQGLCLPLMAKAGTMAVSSGNECRPMVRDDFLTMAGRLSLHLDITLGKPVGRREPWAKEETLKDGVIS